MGVDCSACVAGDDAKPENARIGSTSIGEAPVKAPSKKPIRLINFCEKPAKRRIPVRTYASPLLYKDTKVIFLSGELNRTKEGYLESQYLSSYYIKDLTNDEIKKYDIKCGDIKIDILPTNYACVYTLNPDNDKIYFIVNNKQIITLDLSTNTLQSLNKEISDMGEGNNLAQIGYLDAKICIMGPDKITNNDDEKDDNYVYKVPYKSAMKITGSISGSSIPAFYEYGKLTRIITATINKKNCILMMGGVKYKKPTAESTEDNKQGDEDEKVANCNDEIFVTDGKEYTAFTEESKDSKSKKGSKAPQPPTKPFLAYHTAYPLHSFGIINYKNEYLFQFGGTYDAWTKQNNPEDRKSVRVLRIKENKKDKDEYGLLRFHWYSLEMKIPKVCIGYCHALYVPKMDCIELFNYFGRNFRFAPKVLFDQLKKGQQTAKGNSQGWKILNPWTQMGKTVTGTKSTSVKNLGPQLDSEVDTMLRELGDVYNQYVNVLNDFCTFKDITNEGNQEKLKGIIKDKVHLQKIIDTAKEKSK